MLRLNSSPGDTVKLTINMTAASGENAFHRLPFRSNQMEMSVKFTLFSGSAIEAVGVRIAASDDTVTPSEFALIGLNLTAPPAGGLAIVDHRRRAAAGRPESLAAGGAARTTARMTSNDDAGTSCELRSLSCMRDKTGPVHCSAAGGRCDRCLQLFSGARYNHAVSRGGCACLCSKLGYTLAGLENGANCFCGNHSKANSGYCGDILPESSCAVPCSGNHSSKCGGFEAVEVLSFACSPACAAIPSPPPPSPPAPELLANAGADIRAGPLPSGKARRLEGGWAKKRGIMATEHHLHAFVDHCTVEAFWDNSTTVSTHIWPQHEDSDRLALYLECGDAAPGAKDCKVDVTIEMWRLQSLY
jgi:hypothetical protein